MEGYIDEIHETVHYVYLYIILFISHLTPKVYVQIIFAYLVKRTRLEPTMIASAFSYM